MNKGIKAALLSAFVFPGVGHLLLKKYPMAMLYIGSAMACVYVLISQALENAMALVDKMQSGALSADIDQISQMVNEQVSSQDLMMSNVLTTIFLVVWVVSIVDGYRIGKPIDKNVK